MTFLHHNNHLEYTNLFTLAPDDIHAIATCLGNARRSNGYKCFCPAYDDCNPNLSISLGDHGQLLLYCFAGCVFEDKGLLSPDRNLRDQYDFNRSIEPIHAIPPGEKFQEQEDILCYSRCIGGLVKRIVLSAFMQDFSQKDAAAKIKEMHNV